MREKPSQIALLLLSVALLAPLAFARPQKSTHAAASRKPAHAAEPGRAAAHAYGKPPSRLEERDARRPSKSSSHASERRIVERDLPEPRAKERLSNIRHPADRRSPPRFIETRRGLSRPPDERRIEEPRPTIKHRPAPVEEARVTPFAAPRAEAPQPETDSADLPPIEVRHNRKLHLKPDPPAPAATPRKATIEDFLDTPTAPADDNAPVSPSEAPAATSIAAPAARHPVSIVERKLPALPVLKPIPVIVPDPITEPILYTSAGHLIVPPAMKGSHEILLHQNEMADMDGLIRVQDDADLDRLRALKQLVPLPVDAELEVDERLPFNRRYCRPWTAQFLAALARAHYARFHTPLQVNSAVRTVEFQERLRYTNGNAAPAEGETASPHLTGQAVDLAKHGLSMTEIAWMRGYLMPLVQQGKVDVEEEFQQSCFHISVYKRYMPQAAPRREIPTRRTPATALAAAIQ